MTTYFSFAEDSGTVSPGGSTAGVEESKEADVIFLRTPPPLLPSNSSSTIWDGLGDTHDNEESGGRKQESLSHEVDVALSVDESASFDAIKCTGTRNFRELGAFPSTFDLSRLDITVADYDEESLASNSPSIGAASVLTLDTALQSLKGLALIDDDAFLLESSLRLPPPPPPPGSPPSNALPQKSFASGDNSEGDPSASSSVTPKTVDFEGDSDLSMKESKNGGKMLEMEVADLDVSRRYNVRESSILVTEERGTMTEAASSSCRDQASMTNEPPEIEEKGTMTNMAEDMPTDLVERKVASLCSCMHQLLISIDRLALEIGAALPGDKGRGQYSIEFLVEMPDIDPLSPPSLEDLAVCIDELNKFASSNTDVWNTRLKRSSLQNQSFQKEQRRWRRENGNLRDEIRHLKMQAAESVSHNKKSTDALKEENERLRNELERMKEEAKGAFPTDKMSAIALATSIHRGPRKNNIFVRKK